MPELGWPDAVNVVKLDTAVTSKTMGTRVFIVAILRDAKSERIRILQIACTKLVRPEPWCNAAERISIQWPAGRRAALESQGPFRPAGPLQCGVIPPPGGRPNILRPSFHHSFFRRSDKRKSPGAMRGFHRRTGASLLPPVATS